MHDWVALKEKIRGWGMELGFDAVGFAGVDPGTAQAGLCDWLAAGCHGEMDYMATHGAKRTRPAELVPGTQAVISCRMNYGRRPAGAEICGPPRSQNWLAAPHRGGVGLGRPGADFVGPPRSQNWLAAPHRGGVGLGRPGADPPEGRRTPRSGGPEQGEGLGEARHFAAISRYALGRDYHRVLRNRLHRLAGRIAGEVGDFGHRAFTDSAPVMEVELAKNAGLGWRGKHTLLLARSGSWFFLGELFVALPLPPDLPSTEHCGTCTACLDACPTGAFLGPYRLDARRCISYLTIELKGSLPVELRPLLGQRIYGCDDCQSVCPWNRAAPDGRETDFLPRHGLDRARLTELFAWHATDFNDRLAGSPIRRIGFERWLRNIAVALGNAAPDPAAHAALLARRDHPSALVREHVAWALARFSPGETRP